MSSFRMATLGVAVAGSMMAAQQVAAEESVEIAASAAVASMYLWRGTDLGNGAPVVSGDITASMAGAYAGIWGSSGDTGFGSEYDLYLGYGAEIEGFSFDVSLWNYNYANNPAYDTFGALTDLAVSVGFGSVTFTVLDNIAGGSGEFYYTLDAAMDQFSAKVGRYVKAGSDNNYTHLDLGYAYNDNLAFTLSKIVDTDTATTENDNTLFVVSYSLPIDIK